mgnify:CR=1 FL=1
MINPFISVAGALGRGGGSVHKYVDLRGTFENTYTFFSLEFYILHTAIKRKV